MSRMLRLYHYPFLLPSESAQAVMLLGVVEGAALLQMGTGLGKFTETQTRNAHPIMSPDEEIGVHYRGRGSTSRRDIREGASGRKSCCPASIRPLRHVLSRSRLYRGWPCVSATRRIGWPFGEDCGTILTREVLELRTLMSRAGGPANALRFFFSVKGVEP